MPEKPSKRAVVIGAGPIGIDAALALARLGHEVQVLESGAIGQNLVRWGHITLFSPWSMNLSPRMRVALAEVGKLPDWESSRLHTGAEYVRRVLEPLARHPWLKGRIRTGCKVMGIARRDALKSDFVGDVRRFERPFELFCREGRKEQVLEADLVLDASGVYGNPNHLGSGGLQVPGEVAVAGKIVRDLVDVAGPGRRAYAGRRTLLVGGGHSAATNALGFRDLFEQFPRTRLTWVVRAGAGLPYRPDPSDSLTHRLRVQQESNEWVRSAPRGLRFLPGTVVESLAPAGEAVRVTLRTPTGRARVTVDRVLSQVGFSPDNQVYRELQVHECYATLGPIKLSAALLGSAAGDCLQQTTHGVESLIHPERDFFLVGSKSYGRNTTFLLRVGFEQVTEVMNHLKARREALEAIPAFAAEAP